MATIGIGRLAKQGGVPIDTVRHYEKIGLLRPAGRLASGYRRYGQAELMCLRFIRRAKTLAEATHPTWRLRQARRHPSGTCDDRS